MDLDNKMTISYVRLFVAILPTKANNTQKVMSKMGAGTVGNPRTVGYLEAIYDAVKKSATNGKI